jgi:hypothetical protein
MTGTSEKKSKVTQTDLTYEGKNTVIVNVLIMSNHQMQ